MSNLFLFTKTLPTNKPSQPRYGVGSRNAPCPPEGQGPAAWVDTRTNRSRTSYRAPGAVFGGAVTPPRICCPPTRSSILRRRFRSVAATCRSNRGPSYASWERRGECRIYHSPLFGSCRVCLTCGRGSVFFCLRSWRIAYHNLRIRIWTVSRL